MQAGSAAVGPSLKCKENRRNLLACMFASRKTFFLRWIQGTQRFSEDQSIPSMLFHRIPAITLI